MNNIKNMGCFTLGCVSLFFTHALYAATQPTFSIVPVTTNGNHILMSEIGKTSVIYKVTNNTAITRPLALSTLTSTALSQNTQAVGACGDNPFVLQGHGGSCDLSLVINGSQLQSDVAQAPEVCATLSNGTPTPFLCSQTSRHDSLVVTKVAPYAYIANAGNGTEAGTRCDVDPSTGEFSNCLQGAITSLSLEQVQLTANGRQTYLVDARNQILTCAMPISGIVSNCFTTNATDMDAPQTITFNTAETYAYITNFQNSTITQCDMNSTTHDLTGCVTTGSNITNPQGLVFNAANTYAYITNATGAINVTQCDVNPSSGALDNCIDSGATFSGSTGVGTDSMAFNTGETYAYITWVAPRVVVKCSVNTTTGSLSPCVDANATGLGRPFGIAMTPDNALAFIVNYAPSTGSVTTCSVNAETGDFVTCKDSGATTLIGPTSITLR